MTRLLPVITLVLLGCAPISSAGPAAPCVARIGTGIRWVTVAPSQEHAAIDRWCSAVGGPTRLSAVPAPDVPSGPPVIVSWNTHVGAGDLDRLVTDLRSGQLTGGPPDR